MTDGLVYVLGGFHADDRYAPDPSDAEYEAALRECRTQGHDLVEGWADGLSTFFCQRCRTRWTEDE